MIRNAQQNLQSLGNQNDPRWSDADLWESIEETRLDLRQAAHLHRRVAFGAGLNELHAATTRPLGEVVDGLLSIPQNDPRDADLEKSFEAMKTISRSGNSTIQLPAWWLYRLVHTRRPGIEKLVVFWHGHFATSAAKVVSPGMMLNQNEMLRSRAMGRFEDLVLGVSRDPAMLVYLDSATNRRNHPNENYARELLELFCLGLGNYTEGDIRELARAFTGWELRGESFSFNRFQHDPSEKRLFGQGGITTGEQAVARVVSHPAAAKFIARKLFRYYVSDGDPPSDELLQPLVQCLRENGFEIRAGLRKLLTSRLFFSDSALARKIRSPVELAVGLLRSWNATTSATGLAGSTRELGQALFFPPNVKGWDGGRQWINSATLIGRVNLVARLLGGAAEPMAGGENDFDRWLDATTAENAVARAETLCLAVELDDAQRRKMVELVQSAQGPSRFATAVKALSTLAEFQLS